MKPIQLYLICLLIGLTACPYKEVYKPTVKEKVAFNGLEIEPETLFYNNKRGEATCNVAIIITNLTNSVQRLSFSKSYLIHKTDTLPVERIYSFGNAFAVDHLFELPPKKDTVIALAFRDLEKNFGDSLKVGLFASGHRSHELVYKRVRK